MDVTERAAPNNWTIWTYLFFFFAPAGATLFILGQVVQTEMLFSGVIALAVMNGSINSVIAYITIRLDDKSSESLQHLDYINSEMNRLETTLDNATSMVTSFTGDLEEAKSMFTKVGVDLTDLDLEPVAEVVEKLKENKEGFNEVLDNMKDADVSSYIKQAKEIDWQTLLNSAEDVLRYVKGNAPTIPDMTAIQPTLNLPEPVIEDDEDDIAPFTTYDDLDLPMDGAGDTYTPTVEDEPIIVQPPTSRTTLSRTPPKKNLSLRRR